MSTNEEVSFVGEMTEETLKQLVYHYEAASKSDLTSVIVLMSKAKFQDCAEMQFNWNMAVGSLPEAPVPWKLYLYILDSTRTFYFVISDSYKDDEVRSYAIYKA